MAPRWILLAVCFVESRVLANIGTSSLDLLSFFVGGLPVYTRSQEKLVFTLGTS